MSIVKYKNQSGITYAYESVSVWDPEKKQSRPKRTYLGRVDEKTGEIIKTTGKRGRPRKDGSTAEKKGTADDINSLYKACSQSLEKCRKELAVLKEENAALKKENTRLRKTIQSVYDRVSKELDSTT